MQRLREVKTQLRLSGVDWRALDRAIKRPKGGTWRPAMLMHGGVVHWVQRPSDKSLCGRTPLTAQRWAWGWVRGRVRWCTRCSREVARQHQR